MLKCEICYDWCRSLEVTKQWWDAVRNDWVSLKGTDLPTYVAILAVLRETTIEIFDGTPDCRATRYNHSAMHQDKRGYQLTETDNCKFTPTPSLREKWRSLYETIQVFRNGVVHHLEVKPMNPRFEKLRDYQDPFQNYYRFAPTPDFPEIRPNENPQSAADKLKRLRNIHQLINPCILDVVRTDSAYVDYTRIVYEFDYVERGELVDLLIEKTTELLNETKVL